jgi:hypothetical protein
MVNGGDRSKARTKEEVVEDGEHILDKGLFGDAR